MCHVLESVSVCIGLSSSSVYWRRPFVCLFVYSSRAGQRLMWWVALRHHDASTAQIPAASDRHDIRDKPTRRPSTIFVPCSRAASEQSTSQRLWRSSAHPISRHLSCAFVPAQILWLLALDAHILFSFIGHMRYFLARSFIIVCVLIDIKPICLPTSLYDSRTVTVAPEWRPTGKLCLLIRDRTVFLEAERASICCSTFRIWRWRSSGEPAHRPGGEWSAANGIWSPATDKNGGESPRDCPTV